MRKLSAKEHAIVLSRLISENKIARFAEIGVFEGKLMKHLLKDTATLTIREYWAIDQWKISETEWNNKTQEDWDGLYFNTCRYLPWFNQLRVIKLPSVEAAKIFWPSYFDMVYIDANHLKEFVRSDIEVWLPLVRKGGILAGHDYNPEDKKIKSEVKMVVDELFGVENIVRDECTVWWKRIE